MPESILIVGATSAIAVACARKWAGEGACLFLVGRSPEKLRDLADDLLVRGAGAVDHYTLDMNDSDNHPAMLDACFTALGRVDIALTAHGTLPDQRACELDAREALRELSTNGTSVIAVLTLLANRMADQGQGCIVVISSVAGDRGRPSNYVYGTAKAAVTTFCEGLRARLFKSGVHLLTVKPGFVDTPMTAGLALPKLLVATPEKIATDILRGVRKQSNSIYTPWFWRMIMVLIRNMPTGLFKRIRL